MFRRELGNRGEVCVAPLFREQRHQGGGPAGGGRLLQLPRQEPRQSDGRLSGT